MFKAMAKAFGTVVGAALGVAVVSVASAWAADKAGIVDVKKEVGDLKKRNTPDIQPAA